MKFLSGGGIGGTSGKTDLRGWCQILPQISFQVVLDVLGPAGITCPLPTVKYSMNGIEEIPKFEIILNPPPLATIPGFVWKCVSAVPYTVLWFNSCIYTPYLLNGSIVSYPFNVLSKRVFISKAG